MSELYYNKKRYLKRVPHLYKLVNYDDTDDMSITEFFTIIE